MPILEVSKDCNVPVLLLLNVDTLYVYCSRVMDKINRMIHDNTTVVRGDILNY